MPKFLGGIWRVETIRYRGEKIHVGCGGVVSGGTCLKCGMKKEKRSLGELIFGKGPIIERKNEELDRGRHRRRIRSGKDIFK